MKYFSEKIGIKDKINHKKKKIIKKEYWRKMTKTVYKQRSKKIALFINET